MKICRFISKNVDQPKYGILTADTIRPIRSSNIFDLELGREILTELEIATAEIKFLPPSVPSKIVCVGRNYAEHARELGNAVPTEPLLFLKAPTSLITDGEPIIIPTQSDQVEHEGELAVIIKRKLKNIRADENPLEYVFGYACLNDVTARDLQKRDVQFTRAKSFDTFCPIGHFFETDLNPNSLNLTVRVNAAPTQTGNTAEMVFNVPQLIRYISQQMTLLPGDVIATGTPSGVARLKGGDLCEVEIEGIGILRNPVQAASV